MAEHLFPLVEIFAVIICIHNLYRKEKILSIYSLTFISIEVLHINLVNENIVSRETLFIIYVLFVFYTLVEFEDDIIEAIYNCILTMFIISILQVFMYIPGLIIFNIFNSEDAMLLFINILVCIMVIETRHMRVYCILHSMIKRKDIKVAISVLTSAGIVIYYIYKIRAYTSIPFDVFLTCGIFLVIVLFMIYRWQNLNHEKEQKEKQLEMIRIYNDSFETLVNVVRQNQHDFNNHLLAISNIALEESSEEVKTRRKEYIEKVFEQNKYNKMLYKIGDRILAGYVFSKLYELEKANVVVQYDVNVESVRIEYIPIHILIEMIGILLDNAKEAMEQSNSNKTIKLIINETKEKLSIVVSNVSPYFSDDEIIRFFKKGYSTKGENRGLGLAKLQEYQRQFRFDILVENSIDDDANWLKFSIMIHRASA